MLYAFIRNISGWEILIILGVVLLFFGASRLPALARSLGKSAKEFKEGLEEDEVEETTEESDVS